MKEQYLIRVLTTLHIIVQDNMGVLIFQFTLLFSITRK